MEVRDAVFGEQPGRYIHGKEKALLPRLYPYIEGRYLKDSPCIAYAADADALCIMHHCLHKGPDHIEAPYYTIRELC